MKIKIKDLTWDKAIYPRTNKSRQTITAYAEALAAGAKFPPVKIQRVFNYADGREATIVLDGNHRCEAFQEKGIEEIPVIEWKDHPLDYQENKIPLLLESAQSNTIHGDRLTSNDKKHVARNIAASDPECKYTEDSLADKLGVTRQTINIWITDIRARQKTNRNSTIIRLSRLGWTQVKRMQDKRILGTIGRTLLIAKKTSERWIADLKHWKGDPCCSSYKILRMLFLPPKSAF